MGKKRTKTTASYGYVPHQGTADEAAYRNSLQGADFSSPIVNAFGQAEKDINDSVFEDELPAGAGERIKHGRLFDLRQRKGAALSQAAGEEARFKSQGLGTLAGMTQNPFVQTGGTSTQSGFFGPAFSTALGGSLGAA